MNLGTLKVKFTMKKSYIECRECNTYFEMDEKNLKCRCPMCRHEEDLVIINGKNEEKDK